MWRYLGIILLVNIAWAGEQLQVTEGIVWFRSDIVVLDNGFIQITDKFQLAVEDNLYHNDFYYPIQLKQRQSNGFWRERDVILKDVKFNEQLIPHQVKERHDLR